MYTSVLLFALSGLLPQGNIEESPAWLHDYGTARLQGQSERKPLAVVFGQGELGWEKLAQSGEMNREVRQLLTKNYVCVYINMGTSDGQQLASAFAVRDSRGIIISNRTGELQAFHHQGNMSNSDLAWYLRRYADPERVVASTETGYTFASYYEQPPVRSAPPVSFRNC